MGIPVIQEIRDTISDALTWVRESTPKWVLFILFLSLILIIANVFFPIAFGTFGVVCVDDNEWSGNGFAVWENIPLMLETWSARIGNESMNGTTLPPDGCVETTLNGTTPVHNIIAGTCQDCVVIGENTSGYLYNGVFDNNKGYCDGDASYKPPEDFAWYQSFFGWCPTRCSVPQNFYYESDDQLYYCLNDDLCANMTANDFITAKLERAGFEPTTVEEQRDEYLGAVCRDNKPYLHVFSLEIFRWEYWLALTFIAILLKAWPYIR